jgi:hypothetical protein
LVTICVYISPTRGSTPALPPVTSSIRLHEVEQRRGAAVQGRPADLRRRIRMDDGLAPHLPFQPAVDVRVDAAGNDQAVGSRHRSHRLRQGAGPANQGDASVLHADIGCLGAARQHTAAAPNGQIQHRIAFAGGVVRALARRDRSMGLVRLEIRQVSCRPPRQRQRPAGIKPEKACPASRSWQAEVAPVACGCANRQSFRR